MEASPGQTQDGASSPPRSRGSLGVAAEPEEGTSRLSGPVIGRASAGKGAVRAGNARRGLSAHHEQAGIPDSKRGRPRSQGCNDKYLHLDLTGLLWHPVTTSCIPPRRAIQLRQPRDRPGSVTGGRYELRANERSRPPAEMGEMIRSLATAEVEALVPPALDRAGLGHPGRTGCGSARKPAQSSPPMSPPCGRPAERPRPP